MNHALAYREWRLQLDRELLRRWCISIEDAGLADDSLQTEWRAGESPATFADRFGRKYDLTHRSEIGLRY